MTKPEVLFLLTGIVFGHLFIVFVPPFQVPDEDRHYFRAFQIAEGHFISEVCEGQAGGWLPKSVVDFAFSTESMRWDLQTKTTVSQVLSQPSGPLDVYKRIFIPFRSVVYSPMAYLPAAGAMKIAMLFDASPLVLMYLGRLANLIAWLLLIYLAVKLVTFYKWLLFVLALTPMSLFQAASLSADSITNAFAFLTISLLLRLAFDDHPVSTKRMIALIISTGLLVLTKNIFLLFCFLFFLIPSRRFGSKKKYLLSFLLLTGISLLALMSWSFMIKNLPVFWNTDVFPNQQIRFILQNPLSYLSILAETLRQNYWYYYSGFIGAFGWKFFYLSDWHVRLWILLIAFVSFTDASKEKSISLLQRLLLAGVFALTSVLIFTALYIYWNTVGAPVIGGVQSRYFIPIVPLVLMVFGSRRLAIQRPNFKAFLIPAFTALSLVIALGVITDRFYQ